MKIIKCPRCGSDNFDIISGSILKCKSCGAVFDLTEDIMQSPEEEDDPDFEEVKPKKKEEEKYPTIADYTRMPLLLKRQRDQEELDEELKELNSHPNPLHIKPGNAQICPNCQNVIPKGNDHCPICNARTDRGNRIIRIALIIAFVLCFLMIKCGIDNA